MATTRVINQNWVAVSDGSTPYYKLFDRLNSWNNETVPAISGTAYTMEWSPDGRYLAFAVSAASGPGIEILDTEDMTLVGGTPEYSTYCKTVAWSWDGTMLAVGAYDASTANNRLIVYNTSDWSAVHDTFNVTSNTIQYLAFSPDDAHLCMAYGAYPSIRVFETSGWTYSGITVPYLGGVSQECVYSADGNYLAVAGTSTNKIDIMTYTSSLYTQKSIPAKTGTLIHGISFSHDSAYFACGANATPYCNVYATGATWSKQSPSALTGYPWSCSFSGEDDLLYFGHGSAVAQMMDTSDWSIETTDKPTNSNYSSKVRFSDAVQDSAVLQLPLRVKPSTNIWSTLPSDFVGLAVSHGGSVDTVGLRNGDEVLIYGRDSSDDYSVDATLSPLTSYNVQAPVFSSGGRTLFVGGDNPLKVSTSDRRYFGTYKALVGGFWGAIFSGGRTLSASWSDDGEYFIGQYYDIYQHFPVVMIFNPDTLVYDRSYTTAAQGNDLDELAYYSRAEIAPDASYVFATSSTSGGSYDQTPYVFAYTVDGGGEFTAVDVNLNSISFATTYGLHINWSPDSVYCLIWKYVFKWNTTNTEWEIIDTLTYGDYNFKAGWHPDSDMVAVPINNSAVVYSVASDVFSEDTTLAFTVGDTCTCACWSKDGSALFLGGEVASGDAIKKYDYNGTSFTLDSTTDWSDITSAVVGLSHSPENPLAEDVELQLKVQAVADSFFDGKLSDAGALQLRTVFNVEANNYYAGSFNTALNLKDPSFLITRSVGNLQVAVNLKDATVYQPTQADAGPFQLTFNLPADLPVWLYMLTLVNEKRAEGYVLPVAIEDRIQAAAQRHALDMAANDLYSHTGSDGSSVYDRVADEEYYQEALGQLVIQGYDTTTAEQYMDALWADTDARNVILDGDYEDFGVYSSISTTSPYKEYMCMVFAKWNDDYVVIDAQPFQLVASSPDPDAFNYMSIETYDTFIDKAEGVKLQQYKVYLGSYEIPNLISFTYRLVLNQPSYLETTVAFDVDVFEEIESRSSDQLVVKSVSVVDGVEIASEIIDVDIMEYTFVGGQSKTITISGYSDINFYSQTVPLRNVVLKTIDEDEKLKFRSFRPDFYLRPGCIATYGEDEITVGKIVIYVSSGVSQFMEISEA